MSVKSIKSCPSALFVGASVLVCAMQSIAAFADPAAAPATGSQAFSWTGAYVGAEIGYAAGNSSWDVADLSYVNNGQTAANKQGFVYAGEIGYNYQLATHILVGVEAEIYGSTKSGTSYLGGEGLTAHNKFGGNVSARLGATFNRLLAFGKVGYARANYKYHLTDSYGDTADGSLTRSGLLVGGGLEYALTPKWSFKAEYDHVSYPTRTVTLNGTYYSNVAANIHEYESTVKFGVNYHF